MRATLLEDGKILRHVSGPGTRAEVLRHLGVTSLRGLRQAPAATGTTYYAPGADDYDGACAEVVS